MPIVFALFFISGFAALIYELLWFRQLGFIFGNTVYAATTVVSAYMTGLALGAYVFGRLAHRIRNAVRLFGALEFCIGLYALAMPVLFEALRHAYRWAFHHATDSLEVLTPLRFVLAFACMLLPTTLMGGTLPLLSEALLRRHADFGKRLGWLYGINTLGAVAGILSAGFVLIPSLGLRGTNLVAVCANLLIGVAALLVGRAAAARAAAEPPEPAPAPPDVRAGLVLLASGLAGFIALGFEVLWFRALTLVFGSTTYSFSAMLAVFLFGIAAGSLLLGRLADRTRRFFLMLATVEAGIGLYMVVAINRFDEQPEFLLGYLLRHGFAWSSLVSAQFLITLKLLLVPTMLMGLAFTIASKAVRIVTASPAQAVARVYVTNTLGCVAGTLVAGFALLPMLGLERALTIMAIATLIVAIGLVACAGLPSRAGVGVAIAAMGGIAGLWFLPAAWDHKLMSSGPYFGPHNMVADGKVVLRDQLRTRRLLFYKEGVTATAAVTEAEDGGLSFTMDGKVEADTYPRGMLVQRMIGHLPMLFHPDPRKVLNLGLGAGVTLGSLGRYPVDWLEVVEIEPETTNVASHWAAYNHDIMRHPQLRVTINDGRNHFFCTTNSYDVITSDPYEPVVGGASHLFTVEHFRQAKARLKPGGIMGQWVPMYELSQRDFLAILRSFVHVFPDSVLFFNGLDIVMLGFRDKVALDVNLLRRHFEIPEVRASMAEVGVESAEALLGMFVAEMARTPHFVGPGPLHTDNRPLVEFSAPKHALSYTVDNNQQVLLSNFTDIPGDLIAGLDDDDAERVRKEHEALRLSLLANVRNAAGAPDEAMALLMQANELSPTHPIVRNELGGLAIRLAKQFLSEGRLTEASEQFQIAIHFDPGQLYAYHQLIYLAMKGRRPDYAKQLIDEAVERFPQAATVYMLRAKFWATTGDRQQAYDDFELALSISSDRPDIWRAYGEIAAFFQDAGTAERANAEAARLMRAR